MYHGCRVFSIDLTLIMSQAKWLCSQTQCVQCLDSQTFSSRLYRAVVCLARIVLHRIRLLMIRGQI